MLDFNNIVGHEEVIGHLQNAIQMNKVSHAYIFNGEKGSGKKLLADTFSGALQCETEGSNLCGTCKSCIQMESGSHPDIIKVRHDKYSIGVDDIRTQVNQDIAIKPYSSPHKIYIIADAERMTEEAQNALLKTIEEPPAYCILLLLTDNLERLLPTILSRCVRLDLNTVDTNAVKDYLMREQHIPDYAAGLSAEFSQGNIGRAIRYAASEDFASVKEEVLHLLKYIDEMELYEIIDAVKRLSAYKLEINDYIDLMILWYRDVLMFKVTKNPNVLLYKDEYQYISKQASQRDYEGIENIIKAMQKAKVRLGANANFEVTMELMLFTLKENGNGECYRR